MTRSKLVGLVGAGALSLLLTYVPQFEGTILRGYKDPIGIVTACVGHTATAVLGRPYTKKECEELLTQDLVHHAEGVLDCAPELAGKTFQLASAISFAFNVGVRRFCESTFARKLREEDATACEELLKWVYAGGQVLPGLVKRREVERLMCEGALEPPKIELTSTTGIRGFFLGAP